MDVAVRVRTAEPGDVEPILALWRGAAENRGRPADSRQTLEQLLERDPAALLVAADSDPPGQLVGTIVVGWDGWRAHLYRLAVHPDRRRQGIGGMLIAAADARARALGATRIDAMVLADNDLGQAIWQAAGFDRQDDWRRWVKPLGRPSRAGDAGP
jgi:ribosomal protein S18 acetylase RimI-like enzyme